MATVVVTPSLSRTDAQTTQGLSRFQPHTSGSVKIKSTRNGGFRNKFMKRRHTRANGLGGGLTIEFLAFDIVLM